MTRNTLHHRSGFTLMELMVAVGLLTGVILAVGLVFQGTTKAVSLSQATSETFSGVRALNRQIEKDLSGLDPNGFLVIRSRAYTPAASPEDPNPLPRRYDQIAFIASGSFRNATGTTYANPFTDRSVASSARVWYGQLVVTGDGTTWDGQTYTNESSAVPLASLPTGNLDQDVTLGRHVTCLFPDDGNTTGTVHSSIQSVASIPIIAYRMNSATNIRYGASIDSGGLSYTETMSFTSDITSSRVAAAGYTVSMIMNSILYQVQTNGGRTAGADTAADRWETYNYCYRFRALPNIWATATVDSSGSPSAINGYYRMHPILQRGVPSFQVDWTDGTTNAATGALEWYGLNNRKTAAANATEPSPTAPTDYNDRYIAQFSYDNKAAWPKALRFTYRVTDPNDRLAGGRTFTQIVALPK